MSRLLSWLLGFLLAISPEIFNPQMVKAHYVGQTMQKLTFAPETIELLRQRLASGTPGFLPNDEVSYIASFITEGSDEGSGGYVSFYIPDGTIVTGAAIVEPDGGGGFVKVPPRLPGTMDAGWGDVGNTSFSGAATWSTNDSNTIALCNAAGYSSVDVCPGTLAQAYADTGIFYSNDPDTRFFAHPTADNPDALRATDDNGYNINPSIGSPVDAHNLWDALQVEAFSGTASPTEHHTPALNFGNSRGNTPFNTGSAVAGADSGYKLDHTGEVGPWKRAQYLGSRVGEPMGPAVSAVEEYNNPKTGEFVVMGEPTSAGTAFPLPSDTNHVRISLGQLLNAETKYAKLTLRLGSDEAAAFLVNASVVGGDAGGISNGKDAIWRYFQPSVAVSAAQLAVTKTAASAFVQPNESVNYTISVSNMGFWSATNVVVTDTLPTSDFSYGNTTSTVLHRLDGSTVNLTPTITPSGQTVSWDFGTLLMAEGEYLTIEFDSNVSATAPTGDTLYDNTVEVSYFDRFDNISTEPIATAPIQIVENLFSSKTVSPANAEPGDTVTYQIRIENTAAEDITALRVSELLPTSGGNDATTRFSYVADSSNITGATPFSGANAVSPTINQITGNQEEVVWDFGSSRILSSGESFNIAFEAVLGTGVSDAAYPNNFSIDYSVNNQALNAQKSNQAPVTVKSPLQLTKTVNPTSVTAGNETTYTIILENTGANTFNNIVVRELLPFEGTVNDVEKRFEYVANSSRMAGSGFASVEPVTSLVNGNQQELTWNLSGASLAPGGQATIVFAVKVGENITPSSVAGDYFNTFSATYNKGGTTFSANATDVAPVTVLPLPPLKLSKEVITTSGNTVTYQIAVENRSLTDTLEQVIIYEFLPTIGGLADVPTERFNYLPTPSINDELSNVTGNNTVDKREVQVPAVEEGYDDVNREQISWEMAQDMLPGDKFTLTFQAKTGDGMPIRTYNNALRGNYQVVGGDPSLTDIFGTAPVEILGVINGTVFQDFGSAIASNEGSNLQEEGELGIGEVSVNIYQNWTDANGNSSIDDGEATLIGTTVSNADDQDTIPDGDFRFAMLEAGTYYVQADLQDEELGGLAFGGSVTPIVININSEVQALMPFDRPLVLTKTVDLANVQASGEVTYTITARNQGPAPLESVELYEFLPTSDNQVEDVATRFSYVNGSTTLAGTNSVALKSNEPTVSVGPSLAPYQNEDNREQLLWELNSNLPPGGQVEFSFKARVGSTVTTDTYLNDLKTIYQVAGSNIESDTIDTAPVTVDGASKISGTVFQDFGVSTVTDGNNTPESGELGIGQITITLYEDTNSSGSFESGSDQILNTIDTNADSGDAIADGSYRFIVDDGTYFVRVDTANSDLQGLIYGQSDNPLKVVVAGGEEKADFPFDPALQMIKTVAPGFANAGDEVTYTITLENKSTNPLQSIALYEFLPTSDNSAVDVATRFSYVTGSTTVAGSNSVALKDNEPDVREGPNEAPYDSEVNREQLFWELDGDLPGGGVVEFSFRASLGANAADDIYANDLRALYKLGNDIVVDVIDTAPVTVGAARSPQLLVVKRLTAIANNPIASVVNDPSTTDDDSPFWPTPIDSNSGISTYIAGDIERNGIKPGDELEYTFYFLSGGNVPITNTYICDVIPANTTYVTDSTEVKFGSDAAASSAGQLLADGSTSPCPALAGATKPVLTVNLADNAAGETIPPATSPGTPANSYGYVRFRVTVD